MQIPLRLEAALAVRRSAGMLLALGYSTVVLVGTPFLIPEIADEYGVGLTAASLMGVLQLGGFAIASWGSGRLLTPNRTVLVIALVLAMAANAAAATLPPLAVLLGLRFLSGVALGIITWFAWTNAFGRPRVMTRVSVVGPMIGVAATPGVAVVIDRFGARGLFLLLAVLPLVPLAFVRRVPSGHKSDRGERHRAIPTARVVLLALTAFSFGGSAVYTFGVAVASQQLGMSASVAAIAYTGNALVSIPAAGWQGTRAAPSLWMALTGLAAFLVATSFNSVIFFAAVIAWGFFYWMAIPGVFNVLAEASAYPEERAGDAQAMMAVGRVAGPFVGGLLLEQAGTYALAILGSGLMAGAGAAVYAVRETTAKR